MGLGAALGQTGNHVDAAKTFRDVNAINSNIKESWNNLGLALDNVKKYSEARDCYLRAISLKQDYAEALNNLGHSSLCLWIDNNDSDDRSLLKEARENFKRAENKEEGISSLNMACLASWEENSDDIRHWLRVARKFANYPSCEQLRTAKVFKKLRDNILFMEFMQELCPEEPPAPKAP